MKQYQRQHCMPSKFISNPQVVVLCHHFQHAEIHAHVGKDHIEVCHKTCTLRHLQKWNVCSLILFSFPKHHASLFWTESITSATTVFDGFRIVNYGSRVHVHAHFRNYIWIIEFFVQVGMITLKMTAFAFFAIRFWIHMILQHTWVSLENPCFWFVLTCL